MNHGDALLRLIAERVISADIADIDAINDDISEAQLKVPWSLLCRALAEVDTEPPRDRRETRFVESGRVGLARNARRTRLAGMSCDVTSRRRC